MTPEQVERYKRHLLVKEIGGPGQNKLLNAAITIVGAGALGGQMALSLAAAGVGTIHVFDDDLVELSNLHRQTHFSMSDVGRLKTDALADRIHAVNPDVHLIGHSERWTQAAGLGEVSLLLDGTDNFESRFEMNAATRKAGVPFVTGAVAGWQGQAMLVNDPKTPSCPCYRCFVPGVPTRAGDCNDLGTLGMITTMVAQYMSLIAVKYLLGLPVKAGEIWILDGLNGRQRHILLPQDPDCPDCKS